MRSIFEILRCGFFAALLWPAVLNAQQDSKSGFVRLANAVMEGTGQLTMEIDGTKVNEKGYKPGGVTGGIQLSPGGHTVKFAREGTKEASTHVTIDANETTILIPYAEMVPARDDDPDHWEIRILRLKQRDPEEARSATFVSVSKQPEIKVEMRDPLGGWSSVFVKRLAVTRAPILYQRGYVPLKTADGDLVSIPVAAKGNYVVLLYDDNQGHVRSLNFRDRKFLSAD